MVSSLWSSVWSCGLWASRTLMGLGLKHTESQDVVLMVTETYRPHAHSPEALLKDSTLAGTSRPEAS